MTRQNFGVMRGNCEVIMKGLNRLQAVTTAQSLADTLMTSYYVIDLLSDDTAVQVMPNNPVPCRCAETCYGTCLVR